MKQYNWVIVGCGAIASELAQAMEKEGRRLYGVANRTYENAVRFGEKYGIPKVYRSIGDVFTDDHVDIVYISTPHNTHSDYINQALAHGKHVLCEKSITLNAGELEQVQTMVSAFMISNNVASMSDLKKVRTAHDYLVQTCTPAPQGSQNHADDAWGALIYREANAKGYARGMKALCDAMGVGTYIVSANSSSSLKDYMWNEVLINGEWFIVDVYCDDSTASYATYLVSDSAYRTLGMAWDRNNNTPPACRRNYK